MPPRQEKQPQLNLYKQFYTTGACAMTIPSFSDESPATQSNIAIADYRGDRRPSFDLALSTYRPVVKRRAKRVRLNYG